MYIVILTIEGLYMIISQSEKIVFGEYIMTGLLLELMTDTGVKILVIVIFVLMVL